MYLKLDETTNEISDGH